LPDFDYIGLHGIWSWISDENRSIIVDFIQRKLKVGGVVYIGYNAFPGWSSASSIRHLMHEHAECLGSKGQGIASQVNGAINFFERLLDTNPLFLRANPQIAKDFDMMKSQNCEYLAHEYFNRYWSPMHFATMVEWLEPAKLQFACSAHYSDLVDVINLTADQVAFLEGIPDPMLRETTRDFMVNARFRRDYWVKGLRKLTSEEQFEQLCQLRVMLVTHRADVLLKARGAIGEVRLKDSVYLPILEALDDHRPKTLGQIMQAVDGKGLVFAEVLQACIILSSQGHLIAVQDDNVINHTKAQCDTLNAHVFSKAKASNDLGFVASPVTGGGVSVGRFQQLFLLAIREGLQQPSDWAQFVWQILLAQDQKVAIEGKTLDSEDDNINELTTLANLFEAKQLPILKALKIA